MKIYYDYQICIGQKFGGISRYYYELMHYIEQLGLGKADMNCIGSVNKYFESYLGYNAYPKREGLVGTGLFFIKDFLNRVQTFFKVQKGYDIVHPTYYNSYLANYPKNGAKLVTTVYDMTHEKFTDMFSKRDPTIRQKKKMLFKADHIIAISESTKRDILQFYPEIPEEKISVIYIGSSFSCQKKVENNGKFPEKYILFVGQRGGYKNFDTFFEAARQILDQYTGLSLVCIGGGAFSGEERIKMEGYLHRIVQIDASDDELTYAYSHALCFIFPSMYEGFGIPTLEAFTCGCPVVLSNTSSMPEVGGDAVEYFDPNDATEIASQINKVLLDENLREEMRQKGYKQLEKFDWKVITKQIIECYQKVMQE